ncbi:MAG: hypothetical protein KY475_18875 [Planctomycetes bacterium]|nr:hypothetical protein [Planctomycetota bacterium]
MARSLEIAGSDGAPDAIAVPDCSTIAELPEHKQEKIVRSLSAPLGLFVVFVQAATVAVAQEQAQDRPTEAARRVAEEIRREALRPNHGPEGRPLPLVSHWNVGTLRGTFGPDHQIGLIQKGHHVLPWMSWPDGNPDSEQFEEYHGRLLQYFASLGLPISFRGTQWNAMLVKGDYREGPETRWAGVITPDGRRVPRLSPFGPVEPWKDPAGAYVDQPAMKRAQELYSDPPLILWASNNEPPELRWFSAKDGPLEEQSRRYLERHGRGRSDEFKRRVVGEGWIERYAVMFGAMRDALENETWKKNVRFVGYGAFGPSHFGRWDRWKVHSLICDKWTDPQWHFWDGGSPSYYTHNWNENRDHWVFSTQVESMNWIFMQEEAWRANPDFWFEISTWDGNQVNAWMAGLGVEDPENLAAASAAGLPPERRKRVDPEHLKKSKTLRYLVDGQTYPPERAAGWVQFGMWLLRPRVVREYRGHATPLVAVEPYWMESVRAVDRVYEHESLTEFWRHGQLVAVTTGSHPWQSDVPERYRKVNRWYLLETNLDPPRPWRQDVNLPVFSLALVLGETGSRRWLLYVHRRSRIERG